MIEVRVLRVFCAAAGGGGNPLGVVLDGGAVPEADARQSIAAELGYAETVFVDDPATGAVRIFTPEVELDFAGHPSVGTAWLLADEGYEVPALHPPAGEVTVRRDGELTWIAGRPEWGPRFEFVQKGSPAEIDALEGAPEGYGEVGVWAWIDEATGTIRERVFVPEAGVDEDEATGSAAIRLCAQLDREIEIHQGINSLLHVRPLGDGRYEVGGRVEDDGSREVAER